MSIIKDNRGHPVTPGDTVVYRVPNHWKSKARGELAVGIVHSLTPKGIRVKKGELPKTISRLPDQFIVCILPACIKQTVKAWFDAGMPE